MKLLARTGWGYLQHKLPSARTAGRDTKDKQWSRQLKQRAEDTKGYHGLVLDKGLQME